MPEATDAIWLSVLPDMSKFGPALGKGANPAAQRQGMSVGKKFGLAAAAGVAAVAGGAVLAGKALYEIGQTFDEMSDTIAVGTGKTGKELDGLVESAKTVGASIPADFDQVGQAVSSLNTLTGATGPALEGMMTNVLEASRMLGEDGSANAQLFGQTMQQWQIPAEEGASKLDALYVATQDYGVGLGQITGHLNTYGSVLQNADFTMEESAALFGQLEAGGISVSRVMPGLNKSFRDWAAEGKNSKEELDRTVESIKNAESGTEALSIATEVFGAEGAQRMTTAIRNGTLQLDDLSGALANSDGAIAKSAEQTMSFSEQWKVFKDQVLVGLEPLATRVFAALSDGMRWVNETGIPAVKSFGGYLKSDVIPRLKELWSFLTDNKDVLIALGAAVGAAGVALLAYNGYLKLVKFATAAWNTIQKVLNGTLKANPVGVVVTVLAALVGALVLAYQRSDEFRAVVDRAFSMVRAVAGSVVSWFTGTALPAMGRFFSWVGNKAMGLYRDYVAPAFERVWSLVKTVLGWLRNTGWPMTRTAFQAIGRVAKWLWTNIMQPYFARVLANWQLVFSWLRDTGWPMVRTAFRAIGQAATWLWRNALAPAWRGIKSAILAVAAWFRDWLVPEIRRRINVLRDRFVWLRDRVIRPVWSGVRSVISGAWDGIKSVFGKLMDGVDAVKRAFGRARDGIRAAWAGIKSAVSKPIVAVLNFVNDPLIAGLNRILSWVKVDGIPKVKVPAALSGSAGGRGGGGGGYAAMAGGGKVAGRYIGPTADNVAAWLTPREHVIRVASAERLRREHPGALEHMNATGTLPGLAAGGMVGGSMWEWLADRAKGALSWAGDRAGTVTDLLTSPVGAIKRMGASLLAGIGGGPWGEVVSGAMSKVWAGLAEKIQGSMGGDGGPGVRGTGGWRGIVNRIRAAGFNPSITSTVRRAGGRTLTNKLSRHGLGLAVDMAPHQALQDWLWSVRNSFRELYLPDGRGWLLGKSRYAYPGAAATMANHMGSNAHIHAAYGMGGMVKSLLSNGLAKPVSAGVYDSGGVLAPGQLAVNLSRKPEAVLTQSQLRTWGERRGDGALVNEVHLHGIDSSNERRMYDNLAFELRRIRAGSLHERRANA